MAKNVCSHYLVIERKICEWTGESRSAQQASTPGTWFSSAKNDSFSNFRLFNFVIFVPLAVEPFGSWIGERESFLVARCAAVYLIEGIKIYERRELLFAFELDAKRKKRKDEMFCEFASGYQQKYFYGLARCWEKRKKYWQIMLSGIVRMLGNEFDWFKLWNFQLSSCGFVDHWN